VRVEQRDRRLHIIQGAAEARTGFVRRGQAVEMVSCEPVFHILRAGGSAFFSLTFPDPDRPRVRSLTEPGLVELSSGAGYYWMRAYLFVDDHPYYTRTNDEGRFELPLVPAGHYQIACWLPNWNVARQERDPESTVISRLFFRPPVQREQQVEVRARATAVADFTVGTALFER
jgi:hypothetical protein